MSNGKGVYTYLRQREEGLISKFRKKQLSVQQDLIVNNPSKSESIKNHTFEINTKAFLIVMSIDKSYFAVATSGNFVGIYCAVSGDLVYKLNGSLSPIYTITWHPFYRNIISCSNLNSSVFLWDIFQCKQNECNYQKIWNWSSFSSITYSICFHPFKSIMALARDREIRFIDWEKGLHVAYWRFFSEFSWTPWVSWSFVGNSLIASVGNPQNDCILSSMIETIKIDQKSLSAIHCGCLHHDNNDLCEICDTCDRMSTLDTGPPEFDEYQVNAVDLIRFILSRPEEFFVKIFICVDCRLRFKFWANSISLHEKYDDNSDFMKMKCQLPHDIDSSFVTVIESPIAPEIIWDFLQKLDETSITDQRLKDYIIPKSNPMLILECKNLLRCIAMFERECLRQSVCWCCVQQIHSWIMRNIDFPRFLYESMIEVREIVLDRVKHYDTHIYETEMKPRDRSYSNEFVENLSMSNEYRNIERSNDADSVLNIINIHSSSKCEDLSDVNESIASVELNKPEPNTSLETDVFLDSHKIYSSNQIVLKPDPVVISDFCSSSFDNNGSQKRLDYLYLTLKFLQLYVSEPSRLGDLINIFLTNNLNNSGMSFGPALNGSKVDSYSIRKWCLQTIKSPLQKILPRQNFNESKIIVPHVIFSLTGLTESSIRISKCGRSIAAIVPRDLFKRVHSMYFGNNLPRKRTHSLAFNNQKIFTDSKTNSRHPFIAIYSSEPENTCGQLLYYFDMPYDPISLDFSPLGDFLIVGLSGSQNQAFLFWLDSDVKSHSDCSHVTGPPSESYLNIGLILKINSEKNDRNACLKKPPRSMQLQQIINHKKSIIYHNFNDLVGLGGPINCVIWNTAGGLLYSKEPGSLFSITFAVSKS